MKAHHYVSVSKRTVRGKASFRVALKYFNGNMNSLDATLAEETFRTAGMANARANDWSRRFAAEIIGGGAQ